MRLTAGVKRGRARIAAMVCGPVLAAALVVAAVVAAGAGGAPGPTISGLESSMWSPMEVTIAPGGTVTFQDTSNTVPHGVVWTGGPETPHCEGVPINEGKTNWKGTCTFAAEGVYDFYCYVHGMGMSGKVIVSSGTTTTTTSSTSSSRSTSTSTSRSSTVSYSSSSGTTTASATETSAMSSMPMGGSTSPDHSGMAFLASLMTMTRIASTIPANGDLNPYGVALVTHTDGRLQAGHLLVSNFNDKANKQGTGTTIVQVGPAGTLSLFAKLRAKALPGDCPGGVGLTTALSVLPGDYVVVGSLPTANGTSSTARDGCLIVLNSGGKPVETIAGPLIRGPWDMTAASKGSKSALFISNVLSGGPPAQRKTTAEATVVRIGLRSRRRQAPKVTGERVIANGIPSRGSTEALVVGPTGLALGGNGALYLADTLANSITEIPRAMTRKTAASHGGTVIAKAGMLKGPLGLTLAPNGDILTTNAGDGNMVEITPGGRQLLARTLDVKTGAGSLFGVLIAAGGKGVYFVDDGENTLSLLH